MMYTGEMVWFVGAVEDRDDPEELGRIRVRCFGIHTEDKNIIPTKDLPWATVMLPVNSAGTGSVGQSATGIVQGAWVVGFFTDGKEMQQPLIMGVLPSKPYTLDDDEVDLHGFIDPDGVNPVNSLYDNDQPLPATSNHKYHPNYFLRKDLREDDIETAVPPNVNTVADPKTDSYYDRLTWSSPEVHNGGLPVYPYNKVLAGESGHTLEVDDTPGVERIAQFHKSGTNYEMLNNGDKIETINGENYQIVVKGNNIYVKGNMNITVDKDVRMLVKGNYHLEVEGDYTQNVKGSIHTKIKNSEFKEIGNDFVSNVTDDYTQRIGGMETRIVDSDMRTTITGNEERMVSGYYKRLVVGDTTTVTKANENKTVTGTFDLLSLGDLTIETASNMTTDVDGNKTVVVQDGNVTETINGNQTTAITGNLDVDAARIDLN